MSWNERLKRATARPDAARPRPPINDQPSCVTIMEIGEEEAVAWDAIVAMRKAA